MQTTLAHISASHQRDGNGLANDSPEEHARIESRILLLDVDRSDTLSDIEDVEERDAVPRDEGQVGDGELATDEVPGGRLGEDAVENGEDAQSLLLVPLDRAGHLLRVHT